MEECPDRLGTGHFFVEGAEGSLEPLRDPSFFGQVAVDPETHTVVWPNGADMAPDALHDGIVDPVNAA